MKANAKELPGVSLETLVEQYLRVLANERERPRTHSVLIRGNCSALPRFRPNGTGRIKSPIGSSTPKSALILVRYMNAGSRKLRLRGRWPRFEAGSGGWHAWVMWNGTRLL